MIRSKKTILFIGHEAYRTGASILLLNLIRWIYINRGINVYLILLDGGPLLSDYRKYAHVRVLSKKKHIPSFVQKLNLNLFIQKLKPDLIYFNTVSSIKLFQRYKSVISPFKKVLHIHEMPFSIIELLGSNFILEDFEKVLVVNNLILDFLKNEKFTSNVSLIPEYIDVKALNLSTKKLNIKNPKKVVLGVGVASWRKGFDFFLQTASISIRQFPDQFKFVWLGPISSQDKKRAEYDIRQYGLLNSVELVGESEEVSSFYKNADLLFLSSREDPFPLVMLEAAAFRLPVMYFKGTGGAEEFFNYDPFEIPYGDCQAASETINLILTELDEHLGLLDQFRSKALDCDLDLVIPKILNDIGLDK